MTLELVVAVGVLVVSTAVVVMLLVALTNAVLFPRLRPGAPASSTGSLPAGAAPGLGRLSVLVPARDEAAVIGGTVADLLAQVPPPDELLLLDDGSTDGTAEVARAAAAGIPGGADRLRVIAGASIPPGWAGKTWACAQLAEAATGEILLFADADTRWRPGALAAVRAELARSRADLLGIWPTQVTVTLAERLVVPLMAFALHAYLPILAAHHLPVRAFAAANGQAICFRRTAYDRLGGHETVRGSVLEDVDLAREAKGRSLRLRLADGAGLVACRMYRDWPSVRDGFAKNILAGYGGSVTALVAGGIFHWLVLLAPLAWLLLGWAAPATTGTPLAGSWPVEPAILVGASIATRAVTARSTRQRLGDALLLPLSTFAMTAIAARAIRWAWSGGVHWKGRVIPTAQVRRRG